MWSFVIVLFDALKAQIDRLMLSAFIYVSLISETSVAGWEIEQKPDQILRVNRVPSVDFMNKLIAGSFG
ncbi:hypothetical protein SCA6_000440 [Theobroma cacao]